MTDDSRVGEVVESCTTNFVAQSYELYQCPVLGRMVRTRGDTNLALYGLVYNVLTEGVEPGRRPIARGKDEANEEEIYRSSPQLYKLLKSEFKVLVVGYRQGEKVFQHLPPKPARIHGFVHLCSPDEVKEFSLSLDFLDIVLKARLDISPEELIGASLREISQVYGSNQHTFLITAGKELASLLCSDYGRLKAILKGLKYAATQ